MKTETGPVYLSPFLVHLYRKRGWLTDSEIASLEEHNEEVYEDSDSDEEGEAKGEDEASSNDDATQLLNADAPAIETDEEPFVAEEVHSTSKGKQEEESEDNQPIAKRLRRTRTSEARDPPGKEPTPEKARPSSSKAAMTFGEVWSRMNGVVNSDVIPLIEKMDLVGPDYFKDWGQPGQSYLNLFELLLTQSGKKIEEEETRRREISVLTQQLSQAEHDLKKAEERMAENVRVHEQALNALEVDHRKLSTQMKLMKTQELKHREIHQQMLTHFSNNYAASLEERRKKVLEESLGKLIATTEELGSSKSKRYEVYQKLARDIRSRIDSMGQSVNYEITVLVEAVGHLQRQIRSLEKIDDESIDPTIPTDDVSARREST